MDQLILKLKALELELVEEYEEYLESQFCEESPLNADFESWTDKNCIKYEYWVLENGEDLYEEIESIRYTIYPESY